MSNSSDTVQHTIDEVRRVSSESIASISEMTAGIKEIGTAMEYLVQLSSDIDNVNNTLVQAVQYFKLDDEMDSAQENQSEEETAPASQNPVDVVPESDS